MNLTLLFGVQGSGKGTQAKLLQQKFGFKVFEPGAEFRRISKEESDEGRQLKEIMKSGELVPNHMVKTLVLQFLINSGVNNIIFDGYPRNQEQYETFQEIIAEQNLDYRAIHLTLSKDEAIKRLIHRAKLENRADDTPEGMETRISIFHNETIPIIQEMESANKVININADNDIQSISTEIINKLGLKND